MLEAEVVHAGAGSRAALTASLAVFAILCVAYGVSVSNHLTEDSLWYAHDIFEPTDLFFHPHHLLYDPLMRALLVPASAWLNGTEARLLYLQALNIIFSAAAGAVFCAALLSLGAGVIGACAVSLLFGLSAFSYTYSSQIEVYGLTCLFLGVAVIGLAREDDSKRGRLLTAAGYGAALFFHQTAIFFGLAILARECLRPGKPLARRVENLALTLVSPLAIVGLVYVTIGFLLGHRDPVSFWHWLTLHMQWGHWGQGTISAGTLGPAWRRLEQAVLAHGPGSALPSGILLVALCLYVFARLADRGRAPVRHPSLAAGSLIWMTALAVFTTWWDARGAEFWGMFLMPVCLLLSLIGAGAPGAGETGRSGPLDARRLVPGACLAAMLCVLIATDVTLHRLNEQPDDLRQAARTLEQAARDGDLVWAAGTDGATCYRIYLLDRQVEILAINVKPAREAAANSTPATFTRSLVDVMEREVRAAESRGGRCLIDGRMLAGAISTTRLTESLVPAEFRSALAERFQVIPVGPGLDATIYQLRPRSATGP